MFSCHGSMRGGLLVGMVGFWIPPCRLEHSIGTWANPINQGSEAHCKLRPSTNRTLSSNIVKFRKKVSVPALQTNLMTLRSQVALGTCTLLDATD